MQSVRSQKKIEITPEPIRLTHTETLVSPEQAKKIKISEYISWSVCFGMIAGLTGLMKILKLAITMDSVTSILFYLSLAGLIYFVSGIISVSRNTIRLKKHSWHELN